MTLGFRGTIDHKTVLVKSIQDQLIKIFRYGTGIEKKMTHPKVGNLINGKIKLMLQSLLNSKWNIFTIFLQV